MFILEVGSSLDYFYLDHNKSWTFIFFFFVIQDSMGEVAGGRGYVIHVVNSNLTSPFNSLHWCSVVQLEHKSDAMNAWE